MDPLQAILKYLKDQNRPYNANDIGTNLHNEFSKTVLQKTLDKLVEQDKIMVKTYGKQKVYAIKHDSGRSCQDINKELAELDETEKKLFAELQCLEKELSEHQKQLRSVLSEPTTEALKSSISTIDETIEELNDKLEKVVNKPILITEKEKATIIKEHETYTKLWNKRRRTCMNIVDTILENYPKQKSDFFEEVGIETDEDSGVSSCL